MKCKHCGEGITMYGPETFHTISTMIRCEVAGFKAEPYMESVSDGQTIDDPSDVKHEMGVWEIWKAPKEEYLGNVVVTNAEPDIVWGPRVTERKPFASPAGSKRRTIFDD